MCQKDYNRKNEERKYQHLNYVEKTQINFFIFMFYIIRSLKFTQTFRYSLIRSSKQQKKTLERNEMSL